jgi:two-component system response regulator AlgR
MKSMKVLIVDDEAPARTRLAQLMEDLSGYTVVGQAANGREALEGWDANPADVVLLDIRMPVIDGLETARHLASLDEPPAVIFTTAYDEFAIDAFDVRAIAYLLKPVRRERLAEALQQSSRLNRAQLGQLARDTGHEARQHICARIRNRLQIIPIKDIMCFQADQKYVTVYYMGGEILIDESLKALEEEFSDRFMRIHRNALVAYTYIEALEKFAEGRFRVRLRSLETPFEVSRRLVPQVRRQLREA